MRRGVSVVAVCLMVAGCSSTAGLYDVPLPGGADIGDHPYRVTVGFRDVLDLVPQSGVKVNDVPVGRVERITLAADGRTAEVTLAVNGTVRLPGNAIARLRQSSVLGEKFVELAAPSGTAEGVLGDGAVIPVERTNRNPEIEEVFGALSMLLNGGGVGQIQQITQELNLALGGNETAIRSFLTNVDTFVAGLDARKGDITRAIDGMNKLAGEFGARKDKIADLLDNLGPGIEVLAKQRGSIVGMLKSLDALSSAAVGTIKQSKDDLIADLKALEPTLRHLADAGQNLPQAMEMLLTFPFPDSVLKALQGDYLNVHLKLDSKGGPALPLPPVDQGGR
ncbi:ABC transporter substrate-binding protein [Actinosynnema sp. ALI-1.44]|uniref:MCE family protein n=1 Tax=Actinosynnema sp. ALI-1.44 TaxID=1933779 RepID=UPI00097C5B16|nr:MCE family protein [Actinosynnema sp. ALI-1.44]ONI84063.1 ABC transporter substrate-binding protein [Actinosynnema sp. ALI-1.44]